MCKITQRGHEGETKHWETIGLKRDLGLISGLCYDDNNNKMARGAAELPIHVFLSEFLSLGSHSWISTSGLNNRFLLLRKRCLKEECKISRISLQCACAIFENSREYRNIMLGTIVYSLSLHVEIAIYLCFSAIYIHALLPIYTTKEKFSENFK